MKLLIEKIILFIMLVVNIEIINCESLSNNIFEFLNNFIDSTESNSYKTNSRFKSIGNMEELYAQPSGSSPEPSGSSPAPSGSSPAPSGSSPAPSGSSPAPSTAVGNSTKSIVVDLNDPNAQLNEWFTISSPSFANRYKYPTLLTPDGSQALIDLAKYQRVNGNYAAAKGEGAPNSKAFWFKVRGGYIYYSSTKEDINVLDAIFAKEVNNLPDLAEISNNTATCFQVIDFDKNNWTLCAPSNTTKITWMCSLQQFLNQGLDYDCTPPDQRLANVIIYPSNDTVVEKKKVVQPLILIPMASKSCNEKWNYNNKGADWECNCIEGSEQSPIDLPSKESATISPLKPVFQYEIVSATATDSTYDGLLVAGEQVKIRYDKGAIRIYHSNMGKIVTLDGGVFIAEEISFHTPSEHKLNGQTLDMEMQVVHYGRTKGDIAKQVVLSFLFKKTPGIYNKFLDKIDFFNLPNPLDTFRDLTQDFFIPTVFYSSEEDDIPTMQPFSFYTYQGSLTMPPCSERTTHYVAADPIQLSNTVLTLFKEALKKPDLQNANDPTQIYLNDDGDLENNRDVQPLNGRSVYIYDHRRYGCIEYKQKKRNIKPAGHYEKVVRDSTEYIYVTGNSPSGMPGSFVVSEKEAKGSE